MTNKLAAPAKEQIIYLVETAPNLAESTKKKYTAALTDFLNTGGDLTDAIQIKEYALKLSVSKRAFLKAAIRLWTKEVSLLAKAGATPDSNKIAVITAILFRLDAINEAIKIKNEEGYKAHTWLSNEEVERLLLCCDTSNIVGQRDKAILSTLLHTGVRRSEMAAIVFDNLVTQPIKSGGRTVLNVKGKGAKNRVIPINDEIANSLEGWRQLTGGGRIARALGRDKKLKPTISDVGIFKIVRQYGNLIGKPELAPHDLRRTYAEIGRQEGIGVEQLKLLLGHESIETTMRYLNIELDLELTVSDFVPFI